VFALRLHVVNSTQIVSQRSGLIEKDSSMALEPGKRKEVILSPFSTCPSSFHCSFLERGAKHLGHRIGMA
jgi:hypothetical protein